MNLPKHHVELLQAASGELAAGEHHSLHWKMIIAQACGFGLFPVGVLKQYVFNVNCLMEPMFCCGHSKRHLDCLCFIKRSALSFLVSPELEDVALRCKQ